MNISKGMVYDGNLFYPYYSAFSFVNVPWIGPTQFGKCTNPIRKTNLEFKDVTHGWKSSLLDDGRYSFKGFNI